MKKFKPLTPEEYQALLRAKRLENRRPIKLPPPDKPAMSARQKRIAKRKARKAAMVRPHVNPIAHDLFGRGLSRRLKSDLASRTIRYGQHTIILNPWERRTPRKGANP